MKHQCKSKLNMCFSQKVSSAANLELSALGLKDDSRGIGIQSKFVDTIENEVSSDYVSDEDDVLDSG